jgi:hypothetical protein
LIQKLFNIEKNLRIEFAKWNSIFYFSELNFKKNKNSANKKKNKTKKKISKNKNNKKKFEIK